MLKIKVTFELEEEQVKEIFESYEIKYTKAKLKQLKEELKDQDEYLFISELESEVERILGDLIGELFAE